MGVGAGLYMCDVVKKSSRSLSHLLMSSCTPLQPQSVTALLPVLIFRPADSTRLGGWSQTEVVCPSEDGYPSWQAYRAQREQIR